MDELDNFDKKYEVAYKALVHKSFEDWESRRAEVCNLFVNKKLDLNQHRELIMALALFNINEVGAYLARYKEGQK